MHHQRIIMLCFCLAGISATFMPWISASLMGTVYGTAGDGYITGFLFLVTACLTFFWKDRARSFDLKNLLLASLPALIAGAIGIMKIMTFLLRSNEVNNNPIAKMMGMHVDLKIGLFVLSISGLAVPVAAFFSREDSLSPVEAFETKASDQGAAGPAEQQNGRLED